MADTKVTGLTNLDPVADDTEFYAVADSDGTPASRAVLATVLATYVREQADPLLVVAASDESTAITAGTGKIKFRIPGCEITEVRASLNSACSSGTFTVDVNDDGTTILSTKVTIDATETTSETAATEEVISSSTIANDSEITIDVDDDGDGTATGLKVTLIGYWT